MAIHLGPIEYNITRPNYYYYATEPIVKKRDSRVPYFWLRARSNNVDVYTVEMSALRDTSKNLRSIIFDAEVSAVSILFSNARREGERESESFRNLRKMLISVL